MKFLKSDRRRGLTILAATFLLGGLLLLLWAVWIEPDRLVVAETTLRLPDWPQAIGRFRVVVLSDLHVGSPHINADKVRRIVTMVNEANPDVTVILGDFVIHGVPGGRFVEAEAIADLLKDLRSTHGVFAILGNHDWWYDGNRVRRALGAAGIRVLENDVARIEQHAQPIWLLGLADLWTRKPDIRGALQKVTGDGPIIVLTHHPDIFPEIPARISVTLAGHTHGGQVNLPLLGRLVVPSKFGQRYAIGHVQEGGRHLFVSPGIGTSILPVRFRVPPEISVLTIMPNG